MNKVILMGRLTRNPEIRYSQGDNQMAIARFTLAVDRRFKRDNEATADFISCVAFGRTAEFMDKYTRQGTKLCLEGRIQTGSYNRQDGTKVYTTEVVVENAEFAESKAASQGQQPAAYQGQAQQNYGGQYQQPASYGQNAYGQQPMQQPAMQQPTMQQPSYGGQPAYAQQPAAEEPAAYTGANAYEQPAAPMQEAADEGFMQIPDELNDEGLPFH